MPAHVAFLEYKWIMSRKSLRSFWHKRDPKKVWYQTQRKMLSSAKMDYICHIIVPLKFKDPSFYQKYNLLMPMFEELIILFYHLWIRVSGSLKGIVFEPPRDVQRSLLEMLLGGPQETIWGAWDQSWVMPGKHPTPLIFPQTWACGLYCQGEPTSLVSLDSLETPPSLATLDERSPGAVSKKDVGEEENRRAPVANAEVQNAKFVCSNSAQFPFTVWGGKKEKPHLPLPSPFLFHSPKQRKGGFPSFMTEMSARTKNLFHLPRRNPPKKLHSQLQSRLKVNIRPLVWFRSSTQTTVLQFKIKSRFESQTEHENDEWGTQWLCYKDWRVWHSCKLQWSISFKHLAPSPPW